MPCSPCGRSLLVPPVVCCFKSSVAGRIGPLCFPLIQSTVEPSAFSCWCTYLGAAPEPPSVCAQRSCCRPSPSFEWLRDTFTVPRIFMRTTVHAYACRGSSGTCSCLVVGQSLQPQKPSYMLLSLDLPPSWDALFVSHSRPAFRSLLRPCSGSTLLL